jgi:hypothetical protein
MALKKSNMKKTIPLKQPCKKTIYNSYEEALDMIMYIKENRVGKDLRAYKCSVCGFWHLTSKAN